MSVKQQQIFPKPSFYKGTYFILRFEILASLHHFINLFLLFQESSVAKLGSVCRRVYRIFSHAYFHHRQIFEKFEAETHLCRRFTVFVTKYKLMTRDNLIVPILEDDMEAASAAPAGVTSGESEA